MSLGFPFSFKLLNVGFIFSLLLADFLFPSYNLPPLLPWPILQCYPFIFLQVPHSPCPRYPLLDTGFQNHYSDFCHSPEFGI